MKASVAIQTWQLQVVAGSNPAQDIFHVSKTKILVIKIFNMVKTILGNKQIFFDKMIQIQ